MILAPRQFKRYLHPEDLKPHGSGWGILLLGFALCLFGGFPLLAPSSVSLDLPRMEAPSSDAIMAGAETVVVDGPMIIWRGQSVSLETFTTRLSGQEKPVRLMILSSAQTRIGDILPIIEATKKAGIAHVSFVVKP